MHRYGDSVHIGDVILEFDRKAIEKEGYSTVIPVIITNYDKYLDILDSTSSKEKTEKLITIVY